LPTEAFAVNFTVKPATKFTEDFVAEIKRGGEDDVKLSVRNIFSQDSSGTPFPIGLDITAELKAEDKDKAIEKANGWVSGLLGIASFVSNVGIPPMRAETAYAISPEMEERDFMQFFYDLPLPTKSSGKLRTGLLVKFFGKLLDENTRYNDRIQRSIASYHKSIIQTNPVDQFVAIWFGLEALNQPLKEVTGAAGEVGRCRHCHHQYPVQTMSGVKQFTKNVNGDTLLYDKARKMRVVIMHSTEDISPLMGEIRELVVPLRVLLRKAVFSLLGFKYPSRKREKPVTNMIPFYTAIEGKIHGAKDVSVLRAGGKEPRLESVITSVKSKVKSDETITFIAKQEITNRLEPPATISVYANRMYGEEGKVSRASAQMS